MLSADGVASTDDLLVGAPALTDLARDLLLDGLEGRLAEAADPGGLVLDPEQNLVFVRDDLLL